MARVTTVQKSMKELTCGRCRTVLPKGSAYRWAKPGFRSRTRLIRCMASACSFWSSELTTSKLAEVYAAQEDALEAIDGAETIEDLEGILTDAAERAQAVAEEYREAAEAMGEAGYEMEERADEIDGWADTLTDVQFEELPEVDEVDEEAEQAEALGEALDTAKDEARSALEDMPV